MNRILVIDDEPSMCELVAKLLNVHKIEVQSTTSPIEAIEKLRNEDFDTILTDVNMPEMTGIELCKRSLSIRPDIPIVVMTAFGSMELAVDAIRVGAFDFVTKPVESKLLKIVIERSINHKKIRYELKRLKFSPDKGDGFPGIIGTSPVMKKLYNQIRRIKNHDVAVLLSGERGTGKKLFAKCVHHNSQRFDQPFSTINCGLSSPSIIESELFDDQCGAFTVQNGGTVFLDQIDELSLDLQAKLVQTFDSQETEKPIGTSNASINPRIVAATARDLQAVVEEGRFREDLLYRLNVLNLDLPPLRSRGTDILNLAQFFLSDFINSTKSSPKGFDEKVAEKLLQYSWPGNVMELRNVMERASALAQFNEITADDLPEKILNHKCDRLLLSGNNPEELLPLEQIEKNYIEHTLKILDGNKSKAAKKLGLDRKTLYRKLKNYNDS